MRLTVPPQREKVAYDKVSPITSVRTLLNAVSPGYELNLGQLNGSKSPHKSAKYSTVVGHSGRRPALFAYYFNFHGVVRRGTCFAVRRLDGMNPVYEFDRIEVSAFWTIPGHIFAKAGIF